MNQPPARLPLLFAACCVLAAGCAAPASPPPRPAAATNPAPTSQPAFAVRWQTEEYAQPARWTISFVDGDLPERTRRLTDDDLRQVFGLQRSPPREFVIQIQMNPRIAHDVARLDRAVKRLGKVAAEFHQPGDSLVVWLKVTR